MPAFEVLVCCVGNLCRSPYAERLLSRQLVAAGALPGDVHVTSAGTHAPTGREMDPAMALRLRQVGGDPEGFRSRRLESVDVTRSGLVLAATRSVRRRLLEDAPGAFRRSFTLVELAGLAPAAPRGVALSEALRDCDARRPSPDVDVDLPDPIRQSPEVYDEVAARLDAAVAAVADLLLGNLLDDPVRPRGTRSL